MVLVVMNEDWRQWKQQRNQLQMPCCLGCYVKVHHCTGNHHNTSYPQGSCCLEAACTQQKWLGWVEGGCFERAEVFSTSHGRASGW